MIREEFGILDSGILNSVRLRRMNIEFLEEQGRG